MFFNSTTADDGRIQCSGFKDFSRHNSAINVGKGVRKLNILIIDILIIKN